MIPDPPDWLLVFAIVSFAIGCAAMLMGAAL
jgi:hypothetical protein